jgi:hypothetical protein
MTFTIKLNKKATLRNLLHLDITMKDYYINKEMNADKYIVKYTMKNTTPVQLFNNIYNEKYVTATMLC